MNKKKLKLLRSGLRATVPPNKWHKDKSKYNRKQKDRRDDGLSL